MMRYLFSFQMAWWYNGLNLTCPGNVTVLFLCANGHCINNSLLCDHINHCGDNSDEDFSHAQCYGKFNKEHNYILIQNYYSLNTQQIR